MKATKATEAAIPEIHVEQYAMDISLTCARRPNTVDTAAAIKAMTCRKRAYAFGSYEIRWRQGNLSLVDFDDDAPN